MNYLISRSWFLLDNITNVTLASYNWQTPCVRFFAESSGTVEILGSIPTQIFFFAFVFPLILYFVLFGQLRISGRNRAAPRRTFVHISTSSCNPRGRAHIFAIWWLHTNILYSQDARTCICMYVYCSASLKNKKLSLHAKFLIFLQFLRVMDRHELYQ